MKLILLGSSTLVLPDFLTGCGHQHSQKRYDSHIIFPQSVASGDPRTDSVILWTRIQDTTKRDEDLIVGLEISTNEEFTNIVQIKSLTAYQEYSHAIKVKIDHLEPYTYYYYRFNYHGVYSNIGRTKTAPMSNDEKSVKFAYISCQDYIGRYYNVLVHLLEQDDLDFIIHLGDYIYETNGEPLSQIKGEKRQIAFRDWEGTIKFESYEAARSIDNYRQLYQVYRSDSLLQKVHEKFPMIAIWDDHEFSDDNYGPNSNYFGDKTDERDIERFHNSQRVYLEYMPIEVGIDRNGVMSPQSEVMLDNNEVIIYRDFSFGSNLDLILSDYRSYRPDHMIREDAFPASVFADKEILITNFGNNFYSDPEYQKYFGAYINIADYHDGVFLPVLKRIAALMYRSEGLNSQDADTKAAQVIRGKLNAYYCNEMIKAYNASPFGKIDPENLLYEDDSELEKMDKGLAYINAGKIDLYASSGIGARYMVIKEVFDIYIRLKQLEGAIDSVYGEAQEEWISNTLMHSSSNWRIYASSVSMTPMIVDLSKIGKIDPLLEKEFYLNLDQFDGFKFQKNLLLEKLKEKPSVIISGDIHSTFVTDHHGVVEFTGSSVSSCTFSEALPKYIEASHISDYIDNIDELMESLDMDRLLLESNHDQYRQDPDFSLIKHVDMQSNAYVVMNVEADTVHTSIYSISARQSIKNLYTTMPIAQYFTVDSFSMDKYTLLPYRVNERYTT